MNFEGKQQSLLTFRVGSILCCAPSLPVKSIITPPKLTHPPDSNKSHPGIFKHGLSIVKVIDLRQKFGVEPSSTHGNLIICLFEKESFAFWVDQIIDVFDFPSTGWSNLPPGIPRDVFSRSLIINKNIHLYTEFEKIITMSELSCFKNLTPIEKPQNTKPTHLGSTVNKSETSETSETIKITKTSITNETTITTEKSKTFSEKHKTTNTNNEASEKIKFEKPKKEQQPIKKAPQTYIPKKSVVIKDKESLNLKTNTQAEFKQTSREKTRVEPPSSSFSILIIVASLFILMIPALYYSLSPSIMTTTKHKNLKTQVKEINDIQTAVVSPVPVYESTPIIEMTPSLDQKQLLPEPETQLEPVAIAEPKNDKIALEGITNSKPILPRVEIKKEVNNVIIKIYKPLPREKTSPALIVHTVVNGDTLWAISKKYINNPYRYPELAQLNNIKNPHRIYPGNQVQIHFINK